MTSAAFAQAQLNFRTASAQVCSSLLRHIYTTLRNQD
jgi:hypothetical protein